MCLDKQESLRQLRWAKLLRHFLKLIKKKTLNEGHRKVYNTGANIADNILTWLFYTKLQGQLSCGFELSMNLQASKK